METDRVPAKIGRGSGTKCASSPGKDPAERGRERGTASTSRIAFKGCSFYFRIGNNIKLRSRRSRGSTSRKGIALIRKGHDFEFWKGNRFKFKMGHN